MPSSLRKGAAAHKVDHQVPAHAGHDEVSVVPQPRVFKPAAEQELDPVRHLFGVHRGRGILQGAFPDVAGGGTRDTALLEEEDRKVRVVGADVCQRMAVPDEVGHHGKAIR